MISWLFLLILTILTAVFFSKHIRFFYLVFKLPSPNFKISLLGFIKLITKQDVHSSNAEELINSAPSLFRIILGPYVYIWTRRPQDVEIICNNHLKKGNLYDNLKTIMDAGNSLLASKLHIWQKNRKLINSSFNRKIINSFVDSFTKQAKNLRKNLEEMDGKENKDLMTTIWIYSLRITFDTLFDAEFDDDAIMKSVVPLIIKAERIFAESLHSPWLQIKAIRKISRFFKELTTVRQEREKLVEDIFANKRNKLGLELANPAQNLLFLNNLVCAYKKGLISFRNISAETLLMLPASSETLASAITSVFIALGIYSEIQDMVYNEIISILSTSDDITLQGITQLEYLDRVIKESMRLKPTISYIARELDKDIFSEPFVLPSGCNVIIPIEYVHKNPEVWKDPLKFDPDRFLPEEVEKRHRGAYIPFSHGPRNCIGSKYAMLAMKCIIAEIVRNFEIKTLHPKEFADLELTYNIVNTPQNYSVVLKKRH